MDPDNPQIASGRPLLGILQKEFMGANNNYKIVEISIEVATQGN